MAQVTLSSTEREDCSKTTLTASDASSRPHTHSRVGLPICHLPYCPSLRPHLYDTTAEQQQTAARPHRTTRAENGPDLIQKFAETARLNPCVKAIYSLRLSPRDMRVIYRQGISRSTFVTNISHSHLTQLQPLIENPEIRHIAAASTPA